MQTIHDVSIINGKFGAAMGSNGKNSLEQDDRPPAKSKTVNKLT